MEKYYKTIAVIGIRHRYFTDQVAAGTEVVPLPETARLLRNHRALFRKKGNDYTILQETSVADGQPTVPFENTDNPMLFGIRTNDPHYQLRSGLHFDPRRKRIVASLAGNPTHEITGRDVVTCLADATQVSEKPVTDENGNVVFSGLTDPPAHFASLPAGLYRYGDQQFLKCGNCRDCEAVLLFRLAPAGETVTGTVVFPAGSYHWRFHVQKKYTQPESLALVDENEHMRFGAPATSDKGLVFLSEQPVTLTQQAASSLALYSNDNLLKKHLPVPALESARFMSDTEKTLVLEAYVTI